MSESKPDYDQKYLNLVREIVLSIVDTNACAVFLFGSWARRSHKQSSDIDIGIWGSQPLGKTYHRLMQAIEDSIVPYPVDIVDFFNADEAFRRDALEGAIVWNRPPDFAKS